MEVLPQEGATRTVWRGAVPVLFVYKDNTSRAVYGKLIEGEGGGPWMDVVSVGREGEVKEPRLASQQKGNNTDPPMHVHGLDEHIKQEKRLSSWLPFVEESCKVQRHLVLDTRA